MTNVEMVRSLLDAGKDFRIAEQLLAEIPANPPRDPGREDLHEAWQERLHEWELGKAKAEGILQEAASRYLSLLFDAVSEQVEAWIRDHEYEQHKMHRSEPVGDD